MLAPSNSTSPSGALVAVQVKDSVVDAQVGGFATTARPYDGCYLLFVNIQVVLKQGLVLPVVEVEVARGYFNVCFHGR